MPLRKRQFQDDDPLKSDPEDEDYDAKSSRPRATKNTKSRRTRPARKKRRTTYGSADSEEISDSDHLDDSFEEDEAPEPHELDPRTGRPVRKSARKKVQYEESDGDSIDFMNEIDSADSRSGSAQRNVKSPQKKKQLIVKLKTSQTSRRTRARSGSVTSKRQTTADIGPVTTRRSSRIAHDDREGLYALTNSGHHVEVTRPPTKSPEAAPSRPTKGTKGLKKPPSAIFEAENESSARTKTEPDSDGPGSFGVDPEIAASHDELDDGENEDENVVQGGISANTVPDESGEDGPEVDVRGSAVVLESDEVDNGRGDDEDEDEDILSKPRRSTRRGGSTAPNRTEKQEHESPTERPSRRTLRSAAQPRQTQSAQRGKKRGIDDTSDFEPGVDEGAEENVSSSSDSDASPRKASQENDDSSSNARRSRRLKVNNRRLGVSVEADSEEAEELAEELEELRGARPRRGVRAANLVEDKPQTRKRKPVDYRVIRPDLNPTFEDDGPPTAVTPSRRGRVGAAGGWQRSLFSTYGPFGGAGGPAPVFGGPGGVEPNAGFDSDSSDDDNVQRPSKPSGLGGTVGMTPTSGAPPGFGLFPPAQTHGADPLQTNFGKVKDKQALVDADPLGVDPNVNFDSVGGLDGHIDQLKEMVALPLLYPEIFQRFHVTPPRGVLFHGPPGTGKTLLARALASSVSSQGRKVTFYMRKGADALSKWVGEAERQLRLLFEEARKTQPSIIFFDEIDGLAPVRSSKQDQIHSSIVSTLLALMDGMDGRGQVIIIGATNRPDSVDPALRRPGRFDREFYFGLPGVEARKRILEIHTKGWDPPLSPKLRNELADVTKGYGGADLRSLCTEAALNAVQRRYPQIYKSNEKLLINPETINVTAKDFMISVTKIVPSSERAASSGAAPLPTSIEPLLRQPLQQIQQVLASVIPRKKNLTALEEAQFEDAAADGGMDAERLHQEFERSRVFRPRLLIRGTPGMGQQYLASALLNHFEGLHVQAFDLPTLLGDPARSPEAAVVQLFAEVKRHKPAVIYIPNTDAWYRTVGDGVISTFIGLLRSLSPTDPVLLLGVLECDEKDIEARMIRDLFGFSQKNQFHLQKPPTSSRHDYFGPLVQYINTSPSDFPDPAERKKRVLESLPLAPVEPPKPPEPPSKEHLKTQKKKDRLTLNYLKLRIQPIMDQIKQKYKKFRTGVIDDSAIRYLFDEEDPSIVTSDLPHDLRAQAAFRPYEKSKDEHGEPGLLEQASGKFFYNLEIVTIEKRLSNGYYKRPKDFLADIKKMTKDAKAVGDPERLLKANELQANVEVDISTIELESPALIHECEAVYDRERQREAEKVEKAKRLAEAEGRRPEAIISNMPPENVETSTDTSGAIVLGQPHTNGITNRKILPPPSIPSTLTNGISDLSDLKGHHSTANPSSDDVHITNGEESSSTPQQTVNSSFGPSAQTRPPHFHTAPPASLQHRLSYPGLSQKSAITPMAEGSNPQMYENSASTTSSDRRMTGSSGPMSSLGRPEYQYGQGKLEASSSSGRNEGGRDISMFLGEPASHSQLPDTQEEMLASQPSMMNSSQSQQSLRPVPHGSRNHPSAIHSILNNDTERPRLAVDPMATEEFLGELVNKTSTCTVEQLEQIHSGLMDEIWKTRGSWNRIMVVDGMRNVLEDLLDDIARCQRLGSDSEVYG